MVVDEPPSGPSGPWRLTALTRRHRVSRLQTSGDYPCQKTLEQPRSAQRCERKSHAAARHHIRSGAFGFASSAGSVGVPETHVPYFSIRHKMPQIADHVEFLVT